MKDKEKEVSYTQYKCQKCNHVETFVFTQKYSDHEIFKKAMDEVKDPNPMGCECTPNGRVIGYLVAFGNEIFSKLII